MKKVLLALLVLVCSSGGALAADVSRAHLDNFSQIIRMNGLTFSTADKGAHVGNSERGMQFMVACDDSLYLYYVLVRNDDSFCVEPYGEKGKKCR